MKKLICITDNELQFVFGGDGCVGVVLRGSITLGKTRYDKVSTLIECKQVACAEGNNAYIWGPVLRYCDTSNDDVKKMIKINGDKISTQQRSW